jgi:hypothetical protein
MTRIFAAALAVLLAAGTSAFAKDVSAEAKAAVDKAIAEMGRTIDVDDDVEGDGDGYKVMDVECKDGRYDVRQGLQANKKDEGRLRMRRVFLASLR